VRGELAQQRGQSGEVLTASDVRYHPTMRPVQLDLAADALEHEAAIRR
jgi:hypothetical protein